MEANALELVAREFAAYAESFRRCRQHPWNCLEWEFDRYEVLRSLLRCVGLGARPITGAFVITDKRDEVVHRELVAVEGEGGRLLGWICMQLRAARNGEGVKIHADELRFRPASSSEWKPVICGEQSRCGAERCIE